MELKEGTLINQEYLLEKKLESDAAGVVIAALQPRLHRRVVLRVEPAADPGSLARFARAKQIESEHVPKFFELGNLEDGRTYFVTEFVSGQPLDQVVAQGPLHLTDAVDYIVQACEGVAVAHATSNLHRRLKTASLLLTNDRTGTPCIKVTGFGSPSPKPASVEEMPSPAYRAPEQFTSSRKVDGRADVWSLGVILYELLTRVNPFAEKTAAKTAKHVVEQAVRRPTELRREIPPLLEQAILRCLEKGPDSRWRTVSELGIALSAFGSQRSHKIAARLQHLLNKHPAPAPPSSRSVIAAPSSRSDVSAAFDSRGVRVSDPPPSSDEEVGFRRISKDGITPMSAEVAARTARAQRVADEARTLARESSSRQIMLPVEAEDAERDNFRAIGGPVEEASPGAAPPTRAGISQRNVVLIVVAAAVVFGVLVGVVVRLLDSGQDSVERSAPEK